jgi:hypothetical protein
MERRARVVARRISLHGRQECREDDLRQRGCSEGPFRLFNSSLDGTTRRAIDFHEGEKIDKKALKTLVRAAVSLVKAKAKS